jgi:hypothetical protein
MWQIDPSLQVLFNGRTSILQDLHIMRQEIHIRRRNLECQVLHFLPHNIIGLIGKICSHANDVLLYQTVWRVPWSPQQPHCI